MGFIRNFLMNLPEVKGPDEKKLSFNVKLKWTLIILVAYFALLLIPLYGLGESSLQQFEQLAIILGTSFGSIISLGIGPIVTASIVLQLLVGSKILNLDMQSADGKRFFQGLQKVLAIFFTLFEAIIYVVMGGLSPAPGFSASILILQLFLGGMMIIFMDEVVSKWGFGSGVGLFIVAGVSSELFTRAFSPFAGDFGGGAAGRVWVFFNSIAAGDIIGAGLAFAAIASTILVFLVVVYAQAIKAEIPLSFGRLRGFGVRWPLNFFYTSNIPVILTAALLANVQLFARLINKPWLGTFSAQGTPQGGIVAWLSNIDLLGLVIRGSLTGLDVWRSITYTLFMMAGSIMFAVFWVKTSGTDARSQANQIMSSGLQIPGFRRDPRVLELILARYIMPLTVMGGAAVGLLAAAADLMGALVRGTGILLAVMIIYKIYEEIAQQHAMDMHPAMKKMVEK